MKSICGARVGAKSEHLGCTKAARSSRVAPAPQRATSARMASEAPAAGAGGNHAPAEAASASQPSADAAPTPLLQAVVSAREERQALLVRARRVQCGASAAC